MIWTILHILEIFLWLLLAASGAYILFFALVSMLWKKPVSPLSAYLEGQLRAMREPRQFTSSCSILPTTKTASSSTPYRPFWDSTIPIKVSTWPSSPTT